MFDSMKRVLVILSIPLAFLRPTGASRDLIHSNARATRKAYREYTFDGPTNPYRMKSDFFRELLEEGTHSWISTMSINTGPPDTASPTSNFPPGMQHHPTTSPIKEWIPVASTSTPNSEQTENTFKPTEPQKTNQPAPAPFLHYKPVDTNRRPTGQPTSKSTPAQPTSHPSTYNSQKDGKPTAIPTIVKTTTQPSELISSNPPPTLQDRDVFDCDSNNALSIANPPVSATTAIQFKVVYSVESTANQTHYIERVERQIMGIALVGALQCETDGLFFPNLTATARAQQKTTSRNPFNTTKTNDSCEAFASPCKVFETQFQVVVNKIVDPDVAAFLGYVMLKEKMDDGSFARNIPIIDRCEYLKPLTFLPPMTQTNETSQEGNQSTERLSVSPWSLVAISAMCASGVIAIAVWNKKRVYRNRRHMELVEEASFSSPLET